MVSQHFFMPPYCQKLIGKTAIAAMPNFPLKSLGCILIQDALFFCYTLHDGRFAGGLSINSRPGAAPALD